MAGTEIKLHPSNGLNVIGEEKTNQSLHRNRGKTGNDNVHKLTNCSREILESIGTEAQDERALPTT